MSDQAPTSIRRVARAHWRTTDPEAAISLFRLRGYDLINIEHPRELARLVKGGARVVIRCDGFLTVGGGDPSPALNLLDLAERGVL